MTTPIIICGAAGRMGLAILRCAAEEPAYFRIVGGVEHPDSPAAGRTAGELIGKPDLRAPIVSDPAALDVPKGAVVIEFSSPAATVARFAWSVARGCASVIGTTGLDTIQRTEIAEAARKVPIVSAPNMSVGVNTLFKIAAEVTRILGEGYDVEIAEIHHRFKKDAPSGTARRLGEIIADARHQAYDDVVIGGRSGMPGERPAREIAIHALRGGDVVGEHTVTFAGLGERIELTHRAHSRDTFVRGALRAASWVAGREPGLYDMQDVLGLK
jgi:4-hydroxy-tetrahydrodipicolinate reductase